MRLPRYATRAIVGIVLVLATALAQAAERSSAPPSSDGARSAGVALRARFGIRGHVDGLHPGASRRMPLRIRNPNPFAIRVTRIRTTVQPATGSGCPASSIRVQPYTGSRRIASSSSRRVKVEVRMRVDAPDACAGTRYRLTYRGRATRA
jgi:hypothetical protein